MPLPAAVRARADKVRQQATEGNPSPQPEQEQTVSAVPTSQEPAPQLQPETVAPAPEQRPGFIDPSDYEGRYKALRASRNEDKARAAQLAQDNDALKQQIQALEARREASQPEAKHFEIDEQTREHLGDTEAKVFDQLAGDMREQINQLRSEQQRLESESKAREVRAQERFFEEMDHLAPNWRALNNDASFLQWLDQVDSSTGEVRRSLLNGFVDLGDSRQASRLFQSYGSAAPSPSDQQPVSPELVHDPGTSRPSGALGAEEQLVEVWSPDEVAAFFEKKSQLYRNKKLHGERLREIQAEEAKIRRAIAEGRVQ